MIARMKKFYLFFSGDPSRFLKKIQKDGLAEINELPENLGFVSSEISLPAVEDTLNKTDFLKNLLKRAEGKVFSGTISLTESQEKDIIRNFPIKEKYAEFHGISKEIDRRERIEKKLSGLKSELLLIRELSIAPAELFSMKSFSFCFFLLNKKTKGIPDKILGFKAEKIGEDGKNLLFLTLFPTGKRDKVIKKIGELRGVLIHIKRWNKNPTEIIRKIDAVYRKNSRALESVEEQLKKLSVSKHEIFVFHDYINGVLHYRKAKQKLKTSKFVNGFSGWVKEQDVPALENAAGKLLPESYLYAAAPDVKEDIPIALENKTIIEPFEVVTDLYGRPVYRNLDPTGPLSLFFALSFAFCVSDAAYGLIMIALSLIFMKKLRFKPVIIKFLRLILYSGIATLIIGALTGGWFGDLLNRLPENSIVVKILGRMVILNPLEGGKTTFIFLGCTLIIGYLQILWGLSLNLFNSVRQYGIKKSGESFVLLAIQIFAALLIAFFIASKKGILPAGFIKITAILMTASFIYLMFLKGKDQEGLLMKLFFAANGGYSVIAGNLLGDVLSYSRLFGLGLTSAVLGFVVNEIVFLSTGIPFIGYFLAFLLFIAGHSSNLVLSHFGSYVHTSRLQYLEFFTKFFESGGRPFSPLKETRHYTFIEKS